MTRALILVCIWAALAFAQQVFNGPTLDSSGGTVTNAGSTDTFTNKTMDAEGTGNLLTMPCKVWLPAALCNSTTPGSSWSLPDGTPDVAATPACDAQSATTKGTLDFPDTSGEKSAQQTILLPSDWTGAIDVRLIWYTTATTGNCKWVVSTICTAVDATETDNPSFNTASTVTTAAPGTGSRLQTSSITGVTATGCAAGELLHLRVARLSTDAADTIGQTARLVGVEVTMRRGM